MPKEPSLHRECENGLDFLMSSTRFTLRAGLASRRSSNNLPAASKFYMDRAAQRQHDFEPKSACQGANIALEPKLY